MKLGLSRGEVKVVDYTPEWSAEFTRVKQTIIENVDIQANRIEHIGSIAIKDMPAKPIIDIIIGVDDIQNVDKKVIEQFAKIGFLRLRVERPNEIVLAKFVDQTYQEKTHYIHLVLFQGERWHNLLFFRNYLNKNEQAKEAYAKLKQDYLSQFSPNITDYTGYKESFVKDIFNKRKSLGR
ncbi:GrpB family protein [Gracilibacillus sp. S3-1-1]|uniref:GrpB family protein n=1 Tax=Gracilibacillus pellucidus TaxID=3095368 RepID=A0ACC6M476_9BACI|nr:GrpB family protein [Gracilibacillus sp. S3-1-1]MDX8045617.1 GrpB family protein [Gracilibacillus sp. S3-1-1]